jgi:hypothetical protein
MPTTALETVRLEIDNALLLEPRFWQRRGWTPRANAIFKLTRRNATTRLLTLPRLNFKIDAYTYRSSDRETLSSP